MNHRVAERRRGVRGMRREQTAAQALTTFQQATRYGPQMACVVCHGVHFPHQAVEVGRIRALATPEGRNLYTDMEFLEQHPALFQQLDRRWCCKSCMTSMAAGRIPPLAARNGLAAPWVGLPSSLLDLTQDELEATSLNQIFTLVEGLTRGVEGPGPPPPSPYSFSPYYPR